MQKSNMTEANLQLQEVASFSEAHLRGDSTMAPGEVVLQARIDFLQAQGIPRASIPTCRKEVAQCEGGAPPATVSEAWLSLLSMSARVTRRGSGGFLAATGSFTLGGFVF